MLAAVTLFFASLLLIIVLFVLKSWEVRSERVVFPRGRARADRLALEMKTAIEHTRDHLAQLPPEIAYLSRRLVHAGALGAAGVARSLERQAHRLADLVSHKRGFERRETKSDFLKQVTGYKNGESENPSHES